ncbi:hypothetical protein GSI_10206 [Ganoderma sinense ZZ0214-1]|uniref:SAP domain-containing protein n=1 Tax=Ganoderma sinense ZZ0214-1 TaxID=1077348 RepID=A0A2G8RZZ5_9APHY|nr:hypothetical protein GSI_10206 [Ganoderma sinense ZZ0214-1]
MPDDISDSKLTVNVLKNYMAAYGLRKSGNRGVLIDRLREFSNSGQQGWETQLLQPSHTHERGDISEQAAKSNPTAQRILKLFGPKNESSVFLPKRNGHEVRPISILSEQRKETNDEWAKLVLENNGRQHQCLSKPTSEAPLVQNNYLKGADEDGGSGPKITSMRRMERRIVSCQQEMVNQFEGVHSELSCLHSELAGFAATTKGRPTTPDATGTQRRSVSSLPRKPKSHLYDGPQSVSQRFEIGPTVHTVPTLAAPAAVHVATTSMASSDLSDAVVPRDAIPPANLLTFDFDDSTMLHFDKTYQVSNPPKVTFSDNLSQLFKEWHVSNLLRVNGRGIPVKDWDRFYKKRTGIKQHAWDLLRVQWGTWKFIVEERERFTSEELFWAQYSDKNGNHLNFKTICERLQTSRKESNEKDAAAVCWFFDNDLAQPATHGYFYYKKSGKQHLVTEARTVAAKWRQLLQDKPKVALQWSIRAASFQETTRPSTPIDS